MKKHITLIIIAALLLSQLVACSTQTTQPTAPAAVTDEPPTAAPIVALTETEIPLEEGEVITATLEEFKAAVQDTNITKIRIDSILEITEEVGFERNDDLEIHITENGTLAINEFFNPVGCLITNDGDIQVNSEFARGIANVTNNGTLTVNAGGNVNAGMSNTENYGVITVAKDGELSIDRGSVFNNFGQLINEGSIIVADGGQLNDQGGSIVNNGTLDLSSYFNGDIEKITGSGTLIDNR